MEITRQFWPFKHSPNIHFRKRPYNFACIASCSAKYLASYAATRSHEPGALGEDVARGHLVSGKS
jgi:hypothetical protein